MVAFLILLLSMIAALISEIKSYDDYIHPYIWAAGGIAGLVCNVLGYGIVSWLEGCFSAIVLFIVLLILYSCSNISDIIGGGTLKGFLVIGMVVGRYSLLALANFIIVCAIAILIEKLRSYWKGQLYYGAVMLLISILLTWGEYVLITSITSV